MPLTPPECLIALRPAIERTWKTLLRDEPVLSPLGRPDTLGLLMESTLTQLFAGFTITPEGRWLRACPPIIAPLHGYCACGLGPLRRYFTAGETALRAAARPLAAGEFDDLMARFRLLAQREFNAVCGACHHQDIPGCCALAGKGPLVR